MSDFEKGYSRGLDDASRGLPKMNLKGCSEEFIRGYNRGYEDFKREYGL